MERVGARVGMCKESKVEGVVGPNDRKERAAIDLVQGLCVVPCGHEGQVSNHEEPQLGSEDRIIGLTPHYKSKKGKPFKLWRHLRKKHHTFVCVLLDGQVLKVDEVWRETEQEEGGG